MINCVFNFFPLNMKTKEVKLNTDYVYKDLIVKVIKRNKNSYTQKWETGFGGKLIQKIRVEKEMTFTLDNGEEIFAKELKQML